VFRLSPTDADVEFAVNGKIVAVAVGVSDDLANPFGVLFVGEGLEGLDSRFEFAYLASMLELPGALPVFFFLGVTMFVSLLGLLRTGRVRGAGCNRKVLAGGRICFLRDVDRPAGLDVPT
jgi:hypothetical protein